MTNSLTHHCCIIEINNQGIMIEGKAGSGKTSLAFGLLERAEQLGLKAFWIADDQAHLETNDGCLVARVPETLAGKVELRGFGILQV